ncbi:TetR/AcrR family transcriptional regulator [Streptomyces sp. N35]|uniref:TetR/AcrR family transcriptional regulator n=1 Tax=Streptomyces sp. N35 TaxID=2795730 RepID=UPI0018F57E0D|nr:TetR/AcrR family transcriptional regulator [Streptomyces sp. N35]
MSTENAPSHPPSDPRRTGGRVRSQNAQDAVLAAAVALLEEVGYQGVTIEGVARRANVAKSTIYRWWKSKPTLVMDAYRQTVERRMPSPDTGTLAGDLAVFVAELYRVGEHPVRIKALRGLMAEAQLDPAFAEPFGQWVESRRDVIRGLLAKGIERGELPAGTDLDYAVDQIFGPFWYRLLVGHAPLDPADAPVHVTLLLQGWRGTN